MPCSSCWRTSGSRSRQDADDHDDDEQFDQGKTFPQLQHGWSLSEEDSARCAGNGQTEGNGMPTFVHTIYSKSQ
jgi:hypothetical protein